MSMFNLVIGNSGWPMGVLDTLYDVEPEICPRYRDHWLERDESGDEPALVLAVYARIGGGNREEYAAQIVMLQALPTYVSDADDAYDNTYATFRFRLTKSQMFARMREKEGASMVLADGATHENVWQEFWSLAEPIPRDMAVIWAAMISTLPGNFDEKV